MEKEDLLKMSSGESSAQIRQRVMRAVEIQRERFKNSPTKYNSRMTNDEVKKYCEMTQEAKSMLQSAIDRLNLTGRGYIKTLKVARTIADLEGEEKIASHHIAEALQYRINEKAPTL